ncbi:MAG: hypothetical protein ACPL1F_02300 [bacterium]
MKKYIWREEIKENEKGKYIFLDGFSIIDKNSQIREDIDIYEYKILRSIKDKKGNDIKILYLYPHQHKFIPQEKGRYCEYYKCECGEEKKIPHNYETIEQIEEKEINLYGEVEVNVYEIKKCSQCGDSYKSWKKSFVPKKLKKYFYEFEEIDYNEYFWEILFLEKRIIFYSARKNEIKEVEKEINYLKTLPQYVENLYQKVDGYRIVEKDGKKTLIYWWVKTDPEDGAYYDSYSFEIPEEINDIHDFNFKLKLFYNQRNFWYRFGKLNLIYRNYGLDIYKRYQLLLKDIEMWDRYVVSLKDKIIDSLDKKIKKLEQEIEKIKNQYKEEISKYYQSHKDEVSPYVIENFDTLFEEWYYAWKEDKI